MNNKSIPDEIIQQVLEQNDILQVVGRYVALERSGKNHKGLCPFHSEKSPSFTVTADTQFFYCFGCGSGGNAIKFLMEIEGMSFPEAVEQLAEQAGIPVTWSTAPAIPSKEVARRKNAEEAHELTAKLYHYLLTNTDQGRQASLYLQDRGFSREMVETFRIGYAPPMRDMLRTFLEKRNFSLELMEQGGLLTQRNDHHGEYTDRFRERIMFPIFDSKGKVIAFSGRVLQSGQQPKYLNSPETFLFNKRKQLYNLHLARAEIRKQNRLILFEGFADVIKAWGAGVRNGVATMGTAITDEHAAIIRKLADEVVICYDGDEAGQSAAEKCISMLEQLGCRVTVAVLPEGSDPDDYITQYGGEAFQERILAQALSTTRFHLNRLKKEHDLKQEDGKLQYIHEALKKIALLSKPTEREHFMKELADEFDYSRETLKQELHGIRSLLEKKGTGRDKLGNPWNNGRNKKRISPTRSEILLPAYHNAERNLLGLMMYDKAVSDYVQEQLGDAFNVEIYGALAAYLYAYYGMHEAMDFRVFSTMLQDDRLQEVAIAISMTHPRQDEAQRVIDDYIHVIKRYSQRKTLLKKKKEEMSNAERIGDDLKAAQIAIEILALEREFKTSRTNGRSE